MGVVLIRVTRRVRERERVSGEEEQERGCEGTTCPPSHHSNHSKHHPPPREPLIAPLCPPLSPQHLLLVKSAFPPPLPSPLSTRDEAQ